MGILEIIAAKHLGARALQRRPRLRRALTRLEGSGARGDAATEVARKERIAAIVELCFEYDRESALEEKTNILRTLEEISADEPLEPPTETIQQWETRLKSSDPGYARADGAAGRKNAAFLKKYFSLRAKAGLATQADVAKSAGLRRSYVAVIESGEHVPQQKTLQKLAKAFRVDVSELL
jgi:transcriptional regulator with XRE-family HTH domain